MKGYKTLTTFSVEISDAKWASMDDGTLDDLLDDITDKLLALEMTLDDGIKLDPA